MARENAIFPINWIKDSRTELVKYVNCGLNTNQKLLAYFSQTRFIEIQNGANPLNFTPNFNLSMNIQFPGDGCYLVLQKMCFGNFNDASRYIDGHRNVTPPVYNEIRQQERPFPNISQDIVIQGKLWNNCSM